MTYWETIKEQSNKRDKTAGRVGWWPHLLIPFILLLLSKTSFYPVSSSLLTFSASPSSYTPFCTSLLLILTVPSSQWPTEQPLGAACGSTNLYIIASATLQNPFVPTISSTSLVLRHSLPTSKTNSFSPPLSHLSIYNLYDGTAPSMHPRTEQYTNDLLSSAVDIHFFPLVPKGTQLSNTSFSFLLFS